MMRKTLVVLLTWMAVLFSEAKIAAQKTLFYMQESASSVHSFEQHKGKIDMLVPTWYTVDEHGMVAGEPDVAVLREAKAAHVPVIPIVVLFKKDKLHALFNDQKAQDEMNSALLRECRENGYQGFQLDFENVLWTDRDALSSLVSKTAEGFHREHLQLQIAVVPNAPGWPGSTALSKWMFEEWRGGYDLKALAQSVDLICLMTYDQNSRWTPPGPVDGWIWTKKNLDYALKFVPKEKLSLGIALYGYHWFAGDPGLKSAEKKPNVSAESISEPSAIFLRDTYGAKVQWDEEEHVPWFYFTHDDAREWIFYTDRHAFMDRYDLAKQMGIEGVCSWVLGVEDPAIWDAIPSRR